MNSKDIDLNLLGDNLLGNSYNSIEDLQINQPNLNLQPQTHSSAQDQNALMFELMRQNQSQKRDILNQSLQLSILQQNLNQSALLSPKFWPSAGQNDFTKTPQSSKSDYINNPFTNLDQDGLNPTKSNNMKSLSNFPQSLNFNLDNNPNIKDYLNFNNQNSQNLQNNQQGSINNNSDFNNFLNDSNRNLSNFQNDSPGIYQTNSQNSMYHRSFDSQTIVPPNNNSQFPMSSISNSQLSSNNAPKQVDSISNLGTSTLPNSFDNLSSGSNFIKKDFDSYIGNIGNPKTRSSSIVVNDDHTSATSMQFPNILNLKRKNSISSIKNLDNSPTINSVDYDAPKTIKSDFSNSQFSNNQFDASFSNQRNRFVDRNSSDSVNLGASSESVYKANTFGNRTDFQTTSNPNTHNLNIDRFGNMIKSPLSAADSIAGAKSKPSTPSQTVNPSYLDSNINYKMNELNSNSHSLSRALETPSVLSDHQNLQNGQVAGMLSLKNSLSINNINEMRNLSAGNSDFTNKISNSKIEILSEANSAVNTTASTPMPTPILSSIKPTITNPVISTSASVGIKPKPKPKSKPKPKAKKKPKNSAELSDQPESSITPNIKPNPTEEVPSGSSIDLPSNQFKNLNNSQPFPRTSDTPFNQGFVNNSFINTDISISNPTKGNSFSNMSNLAQTVNSNNPNMTQSTQPYQNNIFDVRMNTGVQNITPGNQNINIESHPTSVPLNQNFNNNNQLMPNLTSSNTATNFNSNNSNLKQPHNSMQYLMHLPLEKFNQIVQSVAIKIQRDMANSPNENIAAAVELPNLEPFGLDLKKIFYSVVYYGGLDKLKLYTQQQQFQVWSLITRSLANNQAKIIIQPQNVIQIYRKWLYPLESIIRNNKLQTSFQQNSQLQTQFYGQMQPNTQQTQQTQLNSQFHSQHQDQLTQKNQPQLSLNPQSNNLPQLQNQSNNSLEIGHQQSQSQLDLLESQKLAQLHQSLKTQPITQNFLSSGVSSTSRQDQSIAQDQTKSIDLAKPEAQPITSKNLPADSSILSTNSSTNLARNNSSTPVFGNASEVSKAPIEKAAPEKRPSSKKSSSKPVGDSKTAIKGSTSNKKSKTGKKGTIPSIATNVDNKTSKLKQPSHFDLAQENELKVKMEIESFVPLERYVETYGGVDLKSTIIDCKPQLPFSAQVYDPSYLNIHSIVMALQSGYPIESSIALNNLLVASTNPNCKIILQNEVFLFDILIDFLECLSFDTIIKGDDSNFSGLKFKKLTYFDCCQAITESIFDINRQNEATLSKDHVNNLKCETEETPTAYYMDETTSSLSETNSNTELQSSTNIKSFSLSNKGNNSLLRLNNYKVDQNSFYSDKSLHLLSVIRNLSCTDNNNSQTLANSQSFLTTMTDIIDNLHFTGIELVFGSKGSELLRSSNMDVDSSCESSTEAENSTKTKNESAALWYPYSHSKILLSLIENYKSWLEIMFGISGSVDLSKHPKELANTFLDTIEFFFNPNSLLPIFNLCPCTGISSSSWNSVNLPAPDLVSESNLEFTTVFSQMLSSKFDPRGYFSDSSLEVEANKKNDNRVPKNSIFVFSENLLVESSEHSCYYLALSLCCFGRLLLLESNRIVISKCNKNLINLLVETSVLLITGSVSNLFGLDKSTKSNFSAYGGLLNNNAYFLSGDNFIYNSNVSAADIERDADQAEFSPSLNLISSSPLSLMWASLALFVVSSLFSINNLTCLESAYSIHDQAKRQSKSSTFFNQKVDDLANKPSHFAMPFLITNDIPIYVDNLADIKDKISTNTDFIRSLFSLLFACFNSYSDCLNTAPKNSYLNIKSKTSTSSINSLKSEHQSMSNPDYWIDLSERTARLLFSLRVGNEHMFHSVFEPYVVNNIISSSDKIPKHFIKMLYELVTLPITPLKKRKNQASKSQAIY
ncbi:hypothetical protein AYI70_g2584 [Smittium culicis]|uniref:ARID domain-containing protein n=1 Tax=Smittium culicis TaxID=133412 RepID=A0A1R1Y7G4_9FUNG|nr:hypothetical protein AYI70_g2584 [Smittium culicis]